MHSPLIEIELVKKAKVRRAKLYYMRERTGKAARLKETFVSKEDATVSKEVPKPTEENAAPEAPKTTAAPNAVEKAETPTETKEA